MSNNISADLARFNGEIGPQYLDVEDKTGGPDGTMKPLTKEILREMIVTNFPELMNVSDETAQQKLDALDNKLQELDQKLMTLDEIKTQLEGTINTRLSGSNVEVLTDLQTTNTGSSIGETQGGSTIALNYSMYKSIVIYIENNHEELISFSAIDFYQKESADISEEERIFRADGFPTTIEAGATAIYTVDDIPELAYPFGSMVLRFFAYPPPNEEEYSIVKVFGGA